MSDPDRDPDVTPRGRRTTSLFSVVDEDGSPRVPVGLVAAALGLLVAVLIGVVLYQLGPILRPLAIASILCYLILPVHRALVRVNVPSVASYVVISLGVIVLMTVLSRVVWVNVTAFAAGSDHYGVRLTALAGTIDDWLTSLDPLTDETEGAAPGRLSTGAPDRGPRLGLMTLVQRELQSRRVSSVVSALFGTFFGFLSTGFIILIYLMFLIAEADLVRRRVHAVFPDRAGRVLDVLGAINRNIATYIRVKTLVSAVVGVLTAGILWAFGVDFAFVWGLLAFLLNFIPFVGSIVAGVLPTLLSLVQFGSWWVTALVGVSLLGAQSIVAYGIEPRLAGRRLDLSPLVILLALAFWSWLWGIVGAVLAVPMAVVMKIVFENIEQTRPAAAMMANAAGTRRTQNG